MRWNSTYLAWKCLLKLHNSIRFVSTSLLSKSDRASQKEVLLIFARSCKIVGTDQIVTRHLCGANYLTLNLVHPYMESLKKKFAPRSDKNETESSRKRTQTESVAEDTNKAIPTDTTLIVTFLNPRFKYFKWSTNSERDRANQLVKKLYDELKINLHVSDDIEYRSLEKNNDDNDNLFSDLEGNFTQTNTEEEDEVSRYVKLQDIRVKDDPLMWWLNHRDSFPTLAQLARKYLSIPATSVLSK
uniref:HAT C-terminal dimerisation domain-containing protein n=1 Tax=Rhizophagus irregularis (strain DAOM 181602 / DAOM 197198 / MUCL 43194) TaxID=747089 RepID=U9U007_RHIID